MMKKGYNYSIKTKIALALIIQLVWQYHYTAFSGIMQGCNKKIFSPIDLTNTHKFNESKRAHLPKAQMPRKDKLFDKLFLFF